MNCNIQVAKMYNAIELTIKELEKTGGMKMGKLFKYLHLRMKSGRRN